MYQFDYKDNGVFIVPCVKSKKGKQIASKHLLDRVGIKDNSHTIQLSKRRSTMLPSYSLFKNMTS